MGVIPLVKINSINTQNQIPEVEKIKVNPKKIAQANFKEKLENIQQEQIREELKEIGRAHV